MTMTFACVLSMLVVFLLLTAMFSFFSQCFIDVPSDAPSDVPSDQPSSVPSSMLLALVATSLAVYVLVP